MELVWIITAAGVGLLLAEMLAPTGGLLAVAGALGLAAAGIVAVNQDSEAIGAGLITVGVISLITAVVIGRKVLQAHTDQPVQTGWEELVGREGEVRDPLDPVGQIWIDGALWKARAEDGARIDAGKTVRVESVDGLTLLVTPYQG